MTSTGTRLLMHLQPSSRQRELIAVARHLARERFAARADSHDRDASFPFDDYADLRTEGAGDDHADDRHQSPKRD